METAKPDQHSRPYSRRPFGGGLPVLRLEHVALNVADPRAMADWYVAHLGMRVVRQVDGPPHTRFLADAAGATVVELYENPAARIPDYLGMDPLELHLAFDS